MSLILNEVDELTFQKLGFYEKENLEISHQQNNELRSYIRQISELIQPKIFTLSNNSRKKVSHNLRKKRNLKTKKGYSLSPYISQIALLVLVTTSLSAVCEHFGSSVSLVKVDSPSKIQSSENNINIFNNINGSNKSITGDGNNVNVINRNIDHYQLNHYNYEKSIKNTNSLENIDKNENRQCSDINDQTTGNGDNGNINCYEANYNNNGRSVSNTNEF